MSARPEQEPQHAAAAVSVPEPAVQGPGLLDEITKNTRIAAR